MVSVELHDAGYGISLSIGRESRGSVEVSLRGLFEAKEWHLSSFGFVDEPRRRSFCSVLGLSDV